MRTFEEIDADVTKASAKRDAEALLHLIVELDALATPKADALASNSRGWAFYLRSDYSAALEHYRHALALCEELGDRSGGAHVIASIGNVHWSTGDHPAALEHQHRALALLEELGKRRGVAYATENIGNVHWSTGDYPAALEHYHRALAILEELGDHSSVARVTGNIGNVHNRTGDYPAALEFYHRALDLHEDLGIRSGVATFTGNIGTVHDSTGDYPAAIEHFHRALALHEELGNRSGVAAATCNIVETYLRMGSDTEALALLATMDAMQIDSPDVRIGHEQHRATLQERNGDLDGAYVTLQRALSEAHDHNLRFFAADTHMALRDLAQKRNDFAAYIEHNNEYTRITEEINGKESTQKKMMQEAQREIAKQRSEHDKHLAVLHSTLPKHIADRIARGETVNDHYDNAAVIFLDIVGFTTISDQLSSTEVVRLLESVFTALDAVCKKHDVVKIKTIGDSYMAVAFPSSVPHSVRNDTSVPRSTRDDTSSLDLSSEERVIPSEARGVVLRAANAALDMLNAIADLPESLPESLRETLPSGLQVRIGLHIGAVTAGVIGTERMQYDVWGDTVNVASRMESTSLPGRIHASEAFAVLLSPSPSHLRERGTNTTSESNEGVPVIPSDSEEPGTWHLELRGETELKGKGLMTTYWLESASSSPATDPMPPDAAS